MTDPRKQSFGPYLRALADLMGLRDWTVTLDDQPTDGAGNFAEASTMAGRKHLKVAVSERFLDLPPEEQRSTMVHELIHAHGAAMDHMLCDVLDSDARPAYKLLMEYMVDGIAEEWARSLPLPSEVRPAPKPRRSQIAMPKKDANGKFMKEKAPAKGAKAPAKAAKPAPKGKAAKGK